MQTATMHAAQMISHAELRAHLLYHVAMANLDAGFLVLLRNATKIQA